MGIACGDVNRDGREDLFVTNFSGERNSLYRSSRGAGFREAADRYRLGGPSIPRLGWGTGLHDYNLDGWLDVSVVNGHVYPAADLEGTDTSYAQVDQLFLGSATGRFAEEPLSHGVPGVGRASVTADFDGDGDLDMVVACMDGPAQYLENQTKAGDGRRWLQVQLSATESHPDAIGARVNVAAGEATWSAEVRTTGGFQSGCSTDLCFGLGAVDRIDALTIHWPSGQVQVLEDVEVDQRLGIQEPAR